MSTPPKEQPTNKTSPSAADCFRMPAHPCGDNNVQCDEVIVSGQESTKKFKVLFERFGPTSSRRDYQLTRAAILDRFTSSVAVEAKEELYKTEDGAAINITIKHQGGKSSSISNSKSHGGDLK